MEVVRDAGLTTCERVFSAKGSDSSVGGVPVVYCPDDDHMEEEVQVQVQEEKEDIGETHGKEQGEGKRERANDQVAHMDDYADETCLSTDSLWKIACPCSAHSYHPHAIHDERLIVSRCFSVPRFVPFCVSLLHLALLFPLLPVL